MLNTLQEDLDREVLDVPVQLHIINEVGYEHGREDMAEIVDLPLLQDTFEQKVWLGWNVNYRDVVVLDENGNHAGVYNLTDNDLADAENLAALESLLMSAMD